MVKHEFLIKINVFKNVLRNGKLFFHIGKKEREIVFTYLFTYNLDH